LQVLGEKEKIWPHVEKDTRLHDETILLPKPATKIPRPVVFISKKTL